MCTNSCLRCDAAFAATPTAATICDRRRRRRWPHTSSHSGRGGLAELKLLLLPSDPNDEKNVMLEIRAGTGGDEAAIWASDLAKLYTKYAQGQGWSTRVISESESTQGGCRDVTIEASAIGDAQTRTHPP